MSRAIRRHHRKRLMRARKNYHNWGLRELPRPPEIVAFYVNTPCPCSCPMCCNPRRSGWRKEERYTIQERRARSFACLSPTQLPE